MSHPYMTLDASHDPHMSAHQEIVEKEQSRKYHDVDVLSKY